MSGTRRAKLRRGWRFVRGVSKSVKKGDLFPAAGRAQPVGAPEGTTEPPTHGGPWTRARKECGWLTITEHRLPVDRLSRPIEVLHLTDVHLRDDGPHLDALCEAISAQRPDLVAITGDVVTHGWTQAAVDRFLGALPDAPLGRWAVQGNWEFWGKAPPDVWRPILEAHGVELLLNEGRHLGPLYIGGTDDLLSGEPDFAATMAGADSEVPSLVLTHSPAAFEKLVEHPVDVVLAGHSHGGQVRLPGLGAAWVPLGTGRFIAGWYSLGSAHLFVSRGLGWSIAPVRLWCPPELARIQLVPS